ncbi:YbhB/YbcL family Raf kinase inhibitor-like protein [Streptomyces sp. NPDC088097]|uniref:YbhB/YbcL family Raf kinase inhibitor-like protein n=1 Tax=Streptomyces sp. NPDC088097 TaxID=3365823 RepID=UPI0037F9DE7B
MRTAPECATTATLDLRAPAFAHGGPIPPRHASRDLGPHISPALNWGALPEGTAQLLLVMEDIDVPTSRPAVHLTALFAPDTAGFDEGELTADNPRVRHVPGPFARTGYTGPRPLPRHGPHRYGFHLHGLDRAILTTTPLTGRTDLPALVAGHVLASGFLEGVHQG